MTIKQTDSICRNEDGSIDFRLYNKQGRRVRSALAHKLAARLKGRLVQIWHGVRSTPLTQKTIARCHPG